jgi:hypothetical protein
MSFEDLIKNHPTKPVKTKSAFSTLSASEKHQVDLQKDQLWQSIMINQGELDFVSLLVKVGYKQFWPIWLKKKAEYLEKNILFTSNVNLENPSDTEAVNRKVDILTKYRAELKQIEQASAGQNDAYILEWQKKLELGVDVEEHLVADPEQYLSLLADKLKFGGIVDRNRLSRLCGFGSQAAKLGDLVTGIKSYSLAGILPSMTNDFQKLIKIAKKKKNPQGQLAQDLLNNLTPVNKKIK